VIRRTSFRAMGTSITVLGPDLGAFDGAVDIVRARFAEEEKRFSRFRVDSELTVVNRASGRWTEISPAFEDLLDLALGAAAATDGLFDPTVHDALVAAGYDRDFDEVLAGARGELHPATPCGRWIEIERSARSVRLPSGVHLDLGGIAKGWTVDRSIEDVGDRLPWLCVNAGGDLRLIGTTEPIDVDVEDPEDPTTGLLRLALAGGAIATSSIRRRAWGEDRHHVIDPATGTPARTDLVQATVWAPTCVDAEIAATHALLLGPQAASRYPAVLVTATEEIIVSISPDGEVAA
jgi:thiamine biosynthesis lipoprotein